MASNEMFTTRSGKMIPVPEMKVPASVLTSAMRLQEDLNAGTGKYTLKYVLILMLARGERGIRASLKQRAKTKTAKAVNAYITLQLALGLPIDRAHVEKLNGILPSKLEAIDTEEDMVLDGDFAEAAEDLTDEQLDAATSPNAVQ